MDNISQNNEHDIAVHIEGVKKVYRLGQIGGGTLQADLQSWWAKKRGKEDPNLQIGQTERIIGQTFMALNGIDLTIHQGERIGIIGGNGAGKSTLLKLLSRVTAPTDGKIELYGRVASMLEVGTGFNGEMTGRENIYMNGAILGMTKSEIDAKMDQIIEFSEVRDFIDTPVKRYSSGMYVKLAFSVAAHLDSEIMIMDEVLAVGDVAFQNKCLDKMKSVALDEGKTVLYVSHNMSTIRNLCSRCIVLNQGKIIFDGDVDEAIAIYSSCKDVNIKTEYDVSPTVRGQDIVKKKCYMTKISMDESTVKMGEDLRLAFNIHCNNKEGIFLFKCILYSASGEILGLIPSDEFELVIGDNMVNCSFNTNELAPGTYIMDVILNEHCVHDYYNVDKVSDTVAFVVEQSHCYYNMGWQKKYWGNILFNQMIVEQGH